MEFNTQAITKFSLGIIAGASLGLLLRYVLFRFLLFISIPISILLLVDYMGIQHIDWLYFKHKWDSLFVFVTPTAIRLYSYLNNHLLIGIIPGIFMGLFARSFFMRK
ncbi:MAG: hypothetical protein E3K37_02380 [Candidatus Kuenenia sp.]|nr:hypothetical protein [Candidatus Kuenenia hertensis]